MEIIDNSEVLFIGDLRKSEANEIKIGDIVEIKNKKSYIKSISPSSDGNFIKVLAIFKKVIAHFIPPKHLYKASSKFFLLLYLNSSSFK